MPTGTWRIANEFMDRHIDSILTARPDRTPIDVCDLEVSEPRFGIETDVRKLGATEMPAYAASRSAVSAQKTASA